MSLRPYLELVKQYGAPNGGPVPLHEINSYRGRLPEGLLEFWAKYGRGIWPGGRSQMCDPVTFAPLLEELFEGDPEFHAKDLLVYAIGAFGNLHLTDGSMRAISIDVNYRFFTVQPFEDGGQDADLDFYLARTLLLDFGDLPEWTDDEGNDMFPSAFAKLGQVAQGEMYGLFPALAAGGDNIAETFKRCPLQNITPSSIS